MGFVQVENRGLQLCTCDLNTVLGLVCTLMNN